jgi:nitrite reductase/ring-hydroxylating ferredoxin subunit
MSGSWVRVAAVADFEGSDRKVFSAGDRPVLVLRHGDAIYALDNRCPHMGFPLERGSVDDCILTCHWHHARFDLASGGTFDQFADDVATYPVEVRDGGIWIDVERPGASRARQLGRLRVGLERDIRLVLAKAAIALLDQEGDPREPFQIGLEFGTRYRGAGWGQGLTMLTCLMNLLPRLSAEDRPRALFHGLNAVSVEAAGSSPRFSIEPLADTTADLATLKRWLRKFVEVRDAEGAERCLVTAVRVGASSAEVADLLFSAITDHRYIQIGHPADFANKALEALDIAGWQHAESVVASLAAGIAGASRMEESNAWRNPVDLVRLLEGAFGELPGALGVGAKARAADPSRPWGGSAELARQLLSDSPEGNFQALLLALRDGATPTELAGAVARAAALRVAQFHTANEFGDWDTVLHTFTNAIHQAIRRVGEAAEDRASPGASPEERALPLLRGVFDAAASIYLDRFLNVPPARLPRFEANGERPGEVLAQLQPLLDRQQRVNEAGELVARYLAAGGATRDLLVMLGKALLREDRNFHTIQMVEAAFRQHELLVGTPESRSVLIAAARYLAAHAPTARAQEQTFQIADRLHRGELLYEE